jgi:ferredoxin
MSRYLELREEVKKSNIVGTIGERSEKKAGKNVVFQPEGKRTQVEIGSTLLDAAIKAGVDLTSICGGKGTCGKCKFIIDPKQAVNSCSERSIYN